MSSSDNDRSPSSVHNIAKESPVWRWITTTIFAVLTVAIAYGELTKPDPAIMSVYLRTSNIAAKIAFTKPGDERARLIREFKSILWGNMLLVGEKSTETALECFKNQIKINHSQIKSHAAALNFVLRQELERRNVSGVSLSEFDRKRIAALQQDNTFDWCYD